MENLLSERKYPFSYYSHATAPAKNLCDWDHLSIYLFKESSWVLTDLNKSRNYIIQVDVTQGGMIPALPLHLV